MNYDPDDPHGNESDAKLIATLVVVVLALVAFFGYLAMNYGRMP